MINYKGLQNKIENIVEESSANISVSFYDLDLGEGFSINGDQQVPSKYDKAFNLVKGL